jgi:hypothetical protein
MSQIYQVTGELTDSLTFKLDEPLPASAGKVRVTVEVVESEWRPGLAEFMNRMWEEQRRRGRVPPTKEEVDGYLKSERESWDS